jgi:hypothetical protein
MKKDLSITATDHGTMNPVQTRIKLFYDNGYRSKEIAAVTGLPKKLIKSISKGECVPEGGDCNRLMLHFDETIARLNIKEPLFEQSPEEEIDTEIPNDSKTKYKIDVKKVALYKGSDDDKMIMFIYGNMLPA